MGEAGRRNVRVMEGGMKEVCLLGKGPTGGRSREAAREPRSCHIALPAEFAPRRAVSRHFPWCAALRVRCMHAQCCYTGSPGSKSWRRVRGRFTSGRSGVPLEHSMGAQSDTGCQRRTWCQ